MSTEVLSHIHLDDRGVAWIDDSNIKVIEVVLDSLERVRFKSSGLAKVFHEKKRLNNATLIFDAV